MFLFFKKLLVEVLTWSQNKHSERPVVPRRRERVLRRHRVELLHDAGGRSRRVGVAQGQERVDYRRGHRAALQLRELGPSLGSDGIFRTGIPIRKMPVYRYVICSYLYFPHVNSQVYTARSRLCRSRFVHPYTR